MNWSMTEPDWQHEAACRDDPEPDLWFPVGTEGPARVQARQAKTICAGCPVREQCLAYGLGLPASQQTGIWGGYWFDVGEHRAAHRALTGATA